MGLFSLLSRTSIIKVDSAEVFCIFSLFQIVAFKICSANLIGNVHWGNKSNYYSRKQVGYKR